MKNVFELFGSNEDREVSGTWVFPAGEFEGAPEFKIARAGGANKKFTNMVQSALKPIQRLIQAQSKNMSPEVIERIGEANKAAFIAACMLDWKNVFDKEGNAVPFSKEAATKLLNQLPALYEELFGFANSLATFQDGEIETDAGN